MSEGRNEQVSAFPMYKLLFVVFVVFLTLKLTETVEWSWWYVTLPLWIPLATIIVVMAGFLAVVSVYLPVYLIVGLIKNLLRK